MKKLFLSMIVLAFASVANSRPVESGNNQQRPVELVGGMINPIYLFGIVDGKAKAVALSATVYGGDNVLMVMDVGSVAGTYGNAYLFGNANGAGTKIAISASPFSYSGFVGQKRSGVALDVRDVSSRMAGVTMSNTDYVMVVGGIDSNSPSPFECANDGPYTTSSRIMQNGSALVTISPPLFNLTGGTVFGPAGATPWTGSGLFTGMGGTVPFTMNVAEPATATMYGSINNAVTYSATLFGSITNTCYMQSWTTTVTGFAGWIDTRQATQVVFTVWVAGRADHAAHAGSGVSLYVDSSGELASNLPTTAVDSCWNNTLSPSPGFYMTAQTVTIDNPPAAIRLRWHIGATGNVGYGPTASVMYVLRIGKGPAGTEAGPNPPMH